MVLISPGQSQGSMEFDGHRILKEATQWVVERHIYTDLGVVALLARLVDPLGRVCFPPVPESKDHFHVTI